MIFCGEKLPLKITSSSTITSGKGLSVLQWRPRASRLVTSRKRTLYSGPRPLFTACLRYITASPRGRFFLQPPQDDRIELAVPYMIMSTSSPPIAGIGLVYALPPPKDPLPQATLLVFSHLLQVSQTVFRPCDPLLHLGEILLPEFFALLMAVLQTEYTPF